jgi:hypothetical protein
MNAATREIAKAERDRLARERIPEREARLSIVREPAVERPHPWNYGKAQKRAPTCPPAYRPWQAVRDAPRHPSFNRVVRACCPISGLTRAALEQHVAAVLQMVDDADRRKEGLF